ncbi:thermonuclease family protein [Ramlibacter sp. USB13]|uniref:Thermonuclease family protein n=1 Tax=Ramlibacter cellulosilyticus TaxID=2764187 RepID=A0A923MUJ6_9BURK|nr:thermonuclease family protein [Ramlibacter cellulosilyticus]MBC5785528.1 thermonuclease family protein [Ramlibacter cellulosilyticus]
MRRALGAAALLLACTAHAADFRATVTHVTDGDTVWVRPAGTTQRVELRLLDLDAPEGCQAFGPQATAALRERVHGQVVQVRTRGADDYGRELARIEHRGEDVGRWLVRNGYAWSMRFHGRSGPYGPLEAQARRERKGLWGAPGAVEPRAFRKRFGSCHGRALP